MRSDLLDYLMQEQKAALAQRAAEQEKAALAQQKANLEAEWRTRLQQTVLIPNPGNHLYYHQASNGHQ